MCIRDRDAAACPQRTVSGRTGHAGIQCDLIELVPVSLFQVVIQRIKAFFAPADWLGPVSYTHLLTGLIVDGIISGVGAVLGFVPQMLVLFFFLAILESCGYMARVAFILSLIHISIALLRAL